ncbi:MAG: ABC transporter ATP-binding protein [Actinomycetaceae bacterium]|nr:ABC transporter ATP-binding protein [Actinomycetaceae bacterium]
MTEHRQNGAGADTEGAGGVTNGVRARSGGDAKIEPIIEFHDFTFQYRAQSKPTLHDVNLTINRGEKVAIVGQSGSGKSTIANVINGLIPYRFPGEFSGTVRVGGIDPTTTPLHETSKIVGTVLQDPDGQFIGLSVAEDIAFALENDQIEHDEMHARVAKAAAVVNIEDRLQAAPQDLSGGQKQRVSMAGVLVDDVQILLFDEPLASLDPASGQQAIETIDALHKRAAGDATIIIIEHRLEDVLHCKVDRIIVVDRGRIVADGTPNEIIASRVLTEHGIREPLYVTALRMAGHDVASEDEPESVGSVHIPAAARAELASWAREPRMVPPDANPILELENIEFGINDVDIIKGVSTRIFEGEVVAICGTNGAGKSTLAKLICGFEKPDTGRVRLRGEDITDTPIARRGRNIGFVLQNPNQMISKTFILEEVSLALEHEKISEDEKQARIERALRTCGLWAYREWPISALSYGQRKRVTIASVMVTTPDIIILDEPTAGQDWAHYTEIMEFLKSLNDSGITIILITHDMHLALEYTDRALVMSDGRIIAEQSSAAVLANPELTRAASLRTTSLYDLALRVADGSDVDATAFIEQFIARENQWREDVLADHLGTGR